jgi:hypothetical protein
MEGATGFECANFLEIFTFEEESELGRKCAWSRWAGCYAIKSRTSKDWRTVNVRLDDAVDFSDRVWS